MNPWAVSDLLIRVFNLMVLGPYEKVKERIASLDAQRVKTFPNLGA